MSGVTPSWLQEIRDYWAELTGEQRETELASRKPVLPSGDTDADMASLQSHPQMLVALTAANLTAANSDN
ncbi:MAG: hypothetical protein ACYC63_08250 [Armatimonadota bacterium]